jgi:lysophospholipase L1-like esterase
VKRAIARVAAALVAAGVVASCGGSHTDATTPAARRTPTNTVLVIGSNETLGDGTRDALRQAWPRLVFNESFAPGSVLVNAATEHATFASAVTRQAPLARDLHPDTALVFLGTDDVADALAPGTVSQSVRDLVAQLRASGARRILVATLPAFVNAAPDPMVDAAIATAASAGGARVVDLHHVDVRTDQRGAIVATPAVHRAIADAFEAALRRA